MWSVFLSSLYCTFHSFLWKEKWPKYVSQCPGESQGSTRHPLPHSDTALQPANISRRLDSLGKAADHGFCMLEKANLPALNPLQLFAVSFSASELRPKWQWYPRAIPLHIITTSFWLLAHCTEGKFGRHWLSFKKWGESSQLSLKSLFLLFM